MRSVLKSCRSGVFNRRTAATVGPVMFSVWRAHTARRIDKNASKNSLFSYTVHHLAIQGGVTKSTSETESGSPTACQT